jgi:hypothetical protein
MTLVSIHRGEQESGEVTQSGFTTKTPGTRGYAKNSWRSFATSRLGGNISAVKYYS